MILVYTPSSSKSPLNRQNIITKEEVAEHATKEDLWMIINGNVYDITEYLFLVIPPPPLTKEKIK